MSESEKKLVKIEDGKLFKVTIGDVVLEAVEVWAITSSAFRAVAYDPTAKVLYLTFSGVRTYSYADFTREQLEACATAESPGKALNLEAKRMGGLDLAHECKLVANATIAVHVPGVPGVFTHGFERLGAVIRAAEKVGQ